MWGTPQGVWGPRLAESRDPGPPVAVRGGTFQGGLGPQAGRIQGPGPPAPVRGGDPANKHFWQFWGFGEYLQGVWGPQAGRFQGPEASWACPRGRPPGFWAGPRPTCPLSFLSETQKVVLCRLSSNPYRVREAKCLLGALTSCRAAGTGREDPQPDNNPFQLRFTVKRTFSAKLRGEAESKKAPLRGVGG